MAGIEPKPPNDKKRKRPERTEADNEYQRFMRKATAEEKAEYRSKKHWPDHVKREFRNMTMGLKLGSCDAKIVESRGLTTSTFKNAIFKSFWRIAQDEGGLMDREAGIRVATSWCRGCEKVGPPLMMYDGQASIIRYLHVEQGTNESDKKLRNMTLTGEVDLGQD